MPHLRPLLSLVVLALLCAAPLAAEEKAKPWRLFILSGQSNMAGMKPEAGFVPEAKKLFPGEEVVYIKVAVGGQPIRLWVAEWNEIAAKHKLTTQRPAALGNQDYYAQIMQQVEKVSAGKPAPLSVSFCWMQGERDAREKLDAAYSEALSTLIANLRRDLKRPDMNFVIGRLSDFGKPTDAPWQAVRKAQVDLASADKLGAWVDCDDLNDKKDAAGATRDDLHYTPAGYELLGRRYARQAQLLLTGKPPAQDGRPE